MQSDSARNLLDRLEESGAPDDIWTAARDYLACAGFDRIIYLSAARQEPPCVKTTLHDRFVATYQTEGFAKDDPFLTYCLPTRQNIATGIAYVDDYDYLSDRSVALIETAAAYGFNAGVSVTVSPSRSVTPEGWNLGSSGSRCEVENIWRAKGTEITFALHALSGRLTPPPNDLTAREHAVMRLLIAGMRTKKIASVLGIAEVTVEFHLRNLREKLDAPTREAAVARYVEGQRRTSSWTGRD